nr:MAG TPA: putative transcriptional regulator [Caudoviricetes sp.]
MSVFDDIKTGLNQAIKYEQSALKAKTTTLEIAPLDTFDALEIKIIRQSTGLTQKKFACFIGVSVKTVEAWESGRNHPDGAACRLLALTKKDPLFPQKSGIVVI